MATEYTLTDSQDFRPGWASLSGRVLEGGFELQELVEADVDKARVKVRVLGDRDLDCVALFYRIAGAHAEAQVELWDFLRQLRHPNLSAPLGAGRMDVEGAETIYTVVRRADESLDAVLAERGLTVDEAHEVVESAARALEALHVNGLVHGCLSTSRVLAVGETIKLPAECVRHAGTDPAVLVFEPSYLAPESGHANVTPASDLWCLGATIFEAMTQKQWTEASRQETGDLPEPYASIALRCLHTDPDGRASLGEVVSLLRGELKPVPRVRAAVAGTSTVLIVPETEISIPPSAGTSVPDVRERTGLVEQSLAGPIETPVLERGAVEPPVTPLEAPVERKIGTSIPAAAPLSPAGFNGTGEVPAVAAAVTEPPIRPAIERNVPSTSTRETEAAGPKLVSRSGYDRVVKERIEPVEHERGPSRLWLWAGVLVLLVLGLIWALRPQQRAQQRASVDSASAGNSAASQPAAEARGSGASANGQTRVLQPDGSAPVATDPAAAASKAPAATTATPRPGSPDTAKATHKADAVAATAATNDRVERSGSGGPAVWRVVAYTYSHREDAEKKAQAINARHGNLHAEVFSPSGGSSPYLLALGGRMTREEAAQLRRRAVSAGMPRDTYIQNFTH